MRVAVNNRAKREDASILVYFILLLILATAIASVGAYVAQTTNVAHRRSDMTAAMQYAQSGAVIACSDLNMAIQGTNGTVGSNLATNSSPPYTKNDALSTSQTLVYQRTITAPFTNQTVQARIWIPNVPAPNSAKIVSSATCGNVTQSATLNINLTFPFAAAIVSINDGTTDLGLDAKTAKLGNVVVNGSGKGPLLIDGNKGLAVMANGRVNVDTTNNATVPAGSVSMTNGSTPNAIPDYTSQGTANSLFDFNRFIAVANATAQPIMVNPKGNNHFTNLMTFITGAATSTRANPLEGIIVVDIIETDAKKDPGITILADATKASTAMPNGINVRGTLFFNFGPAWGPLDKLFNEAAMYINPADLSGLVATNPATYTTGYPPIFTDPTKNPININIAPTYQNFAAGEDLPAVMYSIGTVDMHGPVNISGVVYTPSYVEIENKHDGNTQYVKGSLIMGLGIYYENNSAATSVISYDANAINSLATAGTKGKQVTVAYWQ